MISVAEAKQFIQLHATELQPVSMPLLQAAGKILAQDVYSTISIPSFPQSAMDGYAFLYADWQPQKKITVEGEMAAGTSKPQIVGSGKAMRIFTGAPLPTGADTVVMQEKVILHQEDNIQKISINDNLLQPGTNVRQPGAEIKAGELALQKQTLLTPAAIGFLAGIGIAEVQVIPNPFITIIVTGKELQQPGKPLQYGQLYESNSFSLVAALQHLHINGIEVLYADDEPAVLTQLLQQALAQSNMVLLTGGVSVGNYDFVIQAAANCGVQTIFHKIKQKPGKPLFFGKKESKLIFGLPGNPSSVLTCFYQYVLDALSILTSRPLHLKMAYATLTSPFNKAAGLTHFLKGFYNGATVDVLGGQESYRLSSFAKANCLIKINEQQTNVNIHEQVEVHVLPH